MSDNKILMNFVILLKSRLGRRICMTIFLAVTVIQSIMIIPVYFSYKTERIANYKKSIKYLLEVPIMSAPDKTKSIFPTEYLKSAHGILKEGRIEGIAVFTADGVLIGNETLTKFVHFREDFDPRDHRSRPVLNMMDKHYEIIWMPEDLNLDFIIVSI